jgi:hypothetical protein
VIRLLAGEDLWKQIGKLADGCKQKFAAVAYVTSESPICFADPDVLVVNASDNCIRSGQTSKTVIRKAYRSGAELYSNQWLHSKIIIFDRVVVVGSANISKLSQKGLLEAAVLTDHSAVVNPARAYIEMLKKESEKIDEDFVRHIGRIRVVRTGFPPSTGRRPRRKLTVGEYQTWLASVWELDDRAVEREQEWITKGEATWLRFTGDSTFRKQAKEGDSVIQIWHPLDRKEPIRVYKAEPVLIRQNEPTCTRFFIEEFSKAERFALSWSEFKKTAKLAGVQRKIKDDTLRRLLPDQANALELLWPRTAK